MRHADLDQVLALQAEAYGPEFHEGWQAFSSKLQHHPDSAWVAEQSGQLLAYLFAQPARRGYPPPLNDAGHVIANADTLHLHDLAVSPRARGLGVARALAQTSLDWGLQQGFRLASLVAVQDSVPFWGRLGFVAEAPAKSLLGYGAAATYLCKVL